MKPKQVKSSPKPGKQAKASKTPQKNVPVVDERDDEEEEDTQKKVKSSPKPAKQTKTAKTPQKIVPVVAEEEEDVQEKAVAKKTVNKKILKKAKLVVEPKEESEEDESASEQDEEQSDVEMDADNDEQGENDDDHGQEVGDDDEDEENNDEDVKEEPTIPSKVKSGPLPLHNFPLNKIIHVSKLPKNCDTEDITQAFGRFGKIDQVNLVKKQVTFAEIAFNTSKAALAAIAESNKVTVLGKPVLVTKKWQKTELNKDSVKKISIEVKNIKIGTTATELCKHFESCGEIDFFKLTEIPKAKIQKALITFSNEDAIEKAEKLHGSILNGKNIIIIKKTEKQNYDQHDPELTVVLMNKQSLDNIEVATLEAIFSKCGEIGHIEPVCKKRLLALIKFKTKEAAQKALGMNGKSKNGLDLEVIPYSPLRNNTVIHITNLANGCTEEDLRKHFEKAGEISNVKLLKGNSATICFEDTNGYCKSFLYNESCIKANPIFIQPFCLRKKNIMARKMNALKRPLENGHKHPSKYNKRPFENGNKHSFENGHTAFRAKKFKKN